jgi:hypothetical protein
VIAREQLGLEPAHLAARCPTALDRLAAYDPAHRGIAPEPVGVVHVLVAGEASVDRLTQKTHDAVPTLIACPAVSQHAARQSGQSEGVIEFAIAGRATPVKNRLPPHAVGGSAQQCRGLQPIAQSNAAKGVAMVADLAMPHQMNDLVLHRRQSRSPIMKHGGT